MQDPIFYSLSEEEGGEDPKINKETWILSSNYSKGVPSI
jgi:hypothetical protein